MQKQLNHQEFKLRQEKNKNNIIVVLENLEHAENIGSAFRLADAFNIEGIVIIANENLDWRKIEKTARNCENSVHYCICKNADEALTFISKKNYKPINIEITSESKPLRKVDFAKLGNVALIVGNERTGVSDEMLEKVPNSCHIEMYGNNSSMNVSTALAIALYKVSEDMLELKKNYELI